MTMTSRTRILLLPPFAACLLLLVACGGDRFAGSWAQTGVKDHGRDLVIAKTDSGYRIAFVGGGESSGWLPVRQNGDTLKGTWHVADAEGKATTATGWLSLTYDHGELVYRDSEFGDRLKTRFVRVSGRTTGPTAEPSGE